MQVLIIDDAAELGEAEFWALRFRGYHLTKAPSLEDGVRQARRTSFDCILIGVSERGDRDSGHGESDDRAEIHALAQASAVGLVTGGMTAVRLASEVRNRALEAPSASELLEILDHIDRPALAVAARYDPELPGRIRQAGRTTSTATTPQFAMNRLTDGWYEVVLLEADVPGLTDSGTVTVFTRFNARHLAVLAPAAGGLGIVRRPRPQTINGWVELIETVADCRASDCGRAEQVRHRAL